MTMTITEEMIVKAKEARAAAGYLPCDFLCRRCGYHDGYGYKIIDDDHGDEKQRCFICGASRYIEGADS